MIRSRLATTAVACTAGAWAAVTALSTSAYAIPPESRSVAISCDDSSGMVFAGPAFVSGALTSSAPSPSLPQKLKLGLTISNPANIAPNSATMVFRTVQTSSGGSGVGTVFDFAGTTHPAWGPVPPMVMGPLSAPVRIPAGTALRLKTTTGTPSAANWSIKVHNPVAGNDIHCVGSQSGGSADFTF